MPPPVTPDRDISHACIYCDKKYDKRKYLVAHMRRVHQIYQNFSCQRCRYICSLFFNGRLAGAIISEDVPRYIINESPVHCRCCDQIFAILKRV